MMAVGLGNGEKQQRRKRVAVPVQEKYLGLVTYVFT
jgi:hypothetical protein